MQLSRSLSLESHAFGDHRYLVGGSWKRLEQGQKEDDLYYEQLQDRDLAYTLTKVQLRIFLGFPKPYLFP